MDVNVLLSSKALGNIAEYNPQVLSVLLLIQSQLSGIEERKPFTLTHKDTLSHTKFYPISQNHHVRPRVVIGRKSNHKPTSS